MLVVIELTEKDVRKVVLTAVEIRCILRALASVQQVPLEAVLGHAVRRVQGALHVPARGARVVCVRLHQLANRQSEGGSFNHLLFRWLQY